MVKRILDATASDFAQMSSRDLEQSIRAAEGRTLCCEVLCSKGYLIDGITNAELVAAMGADIVILNHYRVDHPVIFGLPGQPRWADDTAAWAAGAAQLGGTIKDVKELIGRPVGINLEAFPATNAGRDTLGRSATPENAAMAHEQGADLVFITGNPRSGVTNERIAAATREIRAAIGDALFIIAGKHHSSGVVSEGGGRLIRKEDVQAFCASGANAVCLPMPGALPGWTVDMIRHLVDVAHECGKLAWLVVDHSIEGAPKEMYLQLAMNGTMTGADVFEIGDTGLGGVAMPENVFEFSLAIRGRRHTYRRVASSLRR